MSFENIMRLWNDCAVGGRVRPKLFGKIAAKTAAYTVTSSDFGSVITNRGATASVTFTLPTASALNAGEWVLFYCIADYDFIVAAASDDFVTHNDAAASNVGFVTSGERIGGAIFAVSDGTSWLTSIWAEETVSVSVDTSPSASVSNTPSSSPSASTSSSPSSSPSASVSNTPSSSPSSSVSNTPSSSVSNTPSSSISATPSSSPSAT